jgi:photosystem II stability/assembly factor-like uncharacterized protein
VKKKIGEYKMKIIVTILILFISLQVCVKADWEKCNVPTTGSFTSIAVKGDTAFAGSQNAGLFRSTDLGISWQKLETNIDTSKIWQISFIQDRIFACCSDGVYFSTNGGNTWILSLKFSVYEQSDSFIEYNGFFLVASKGGLFKSNDLGINWTKLNFDTTGRGNLRTIYKNGNKLLAKTSSTIFESIDNGNTWHENGKKYTSKLLVLNGKLYSMSRRVYSSSDDGKSWDSISSDIPAQNNALSWHYSNGKIYVGTLFSGVYVSSDDGKSWKSYGLNFSSVNSIYKTNNGMIVSTYDGGILTTIDEGKTWSKYGYDRIYVNNFDFDDNIPFAATGDGLYKSIDSFKTWNYYEYNDCFVNSVVCEEGKIMASVVAHRTAINPDDWEYDLSGIYVSYNKGSNWTQKTKGNTVYNSNFLLYNHGRIMSGTDLGVYLSVDFGETWSFTLPAKNYIKQILKVNEDIYACTYQGLYISKSNGSDWTDVKEVNPIQTSTPLIRNVGNTIIVERFSDNNRYYLSNDLGKSWVLTDNPVHLPYIINKDLNVIFDLFGEKVLMSTDNGQTWLDFDEGLQSKVHRLTIYGGYIIVENDEGILRRKISSLKDASSIRGNDLVKTFSISPNPATDYINIKPSEGLETSEGYKIQIFDILGIEVSSAGGDVNEVDGCGCIRIDVSNLPAGVYFIRIGDKVEKFLKM